MATPELAIAQTTREAAHFGRIMKNGLEYLSNAINSYDDNEKLNFYREKLVKYEEISDRVEYEIVKFLNDLDKGSLSDESKGSSSLWETAGSLSAARC